MTYETTEKSIQGGRPREIYTFALSGGTYFLTSSKENETYADIVYLSTPGLSRGNAVESPLGQAREMTVTLPLTHAIAADLIANGIPPRQATLTILRFHDPSDTAYQVWIGGIAECSLDDQYVRLRVPSLLEIAFDIKMPVLKADRRCPHALYGPGCQAARGGFNTPVLSVDGVTINLGISDPDGFLDGGEIVRVDDDEKRTILANVGGALTVDVEFRTLDPGDIVNIVPGCDGLVTTCRDKFNNVVNFGGHPDLPQVNPSTSSGPKSPSIWDALR